MTRKRILILLMVLALVMACFFGCKGNDAEVPGNDKGDSQVEDAGTDGSNSGSVIDFDDLINDGAGDNKGETTDNDNKSEDNKSEDNKSEDNKTEDNKPEDNKPEDNEPEDNKPEDNKPEQGDEQNRDGVIENEDTDVDVPI